MKVLILCLLACTVCAELVKLPLSEREQEWVDKSELERKGGWVYLSIEGEPMERGFQHGYNLAPEYKAAFDAIKKLTYETTGKTLQFFIDNSVKFHKDKVPAEYIEEMKGIADGLTKAGVPTTLDTIIGWNGYEEMTGYWWPTVLPQYGSIWKQPGKFAYAHCSAFAATGNATLDGKVVIGHETFIEFWQGQFYNIILDIKPSKGFEVKMQTYPGYIASMTDFWLSGSGIAVVETTIAGYFGYNVSAVPEYVRAREATQYAKTIHHWVEILESRNTGGYANAWLLADIHTNEIGRYEQGLIYQSFSVKKDGYFFGDNVVSDPRIRNLECSDTGYNDIRQQTGARRTRWPMMLDEYFGKIDYQIGQVMLGDTYDVYTQKVDPSSRTICSHYDADPQPYVSDPNAVWNVPFYPAGSVDGKVTSYEMAKDMKISVRFGRADGDAFDADQFLKEHPQWNWQAGVLKSRPSQPWVTL
eukprot:TRINITY_DN1652_c0_g1_i1.p1 TRINITY_DN1652_c0_g1~~TRINITY_DN1652_c0_g1_i1.p1  ORF type:complete len:472 (-),score=80.46 TRINITY_DN1652_c0_g1_i1:74-1489(-)